jgi:hypothetical protein
MVGVTLSLLVHGFIWFDQRFLFAALLGRVPHWFSLVPGCRSFPGKGSMESACSSRLRRSAGE